MRVDERQREAARPLRAAEAGEAPVVTQVQLAKRVPVASEYLRHNARIVLFHPIH